MTSRAHAADPPMPPLERAVVADAMHTGILACPPETPLRIVARMMATNRIHSVLVLGDPRNFTDERAWRIVTDLDVVRTVGAQLDERTAGDAATSPIATVTPRDPLITAAKLMGEQAITHLVVVDPDIDHPVGIISSLDIATAAGRAPHESAAPAPA